MNTIKFGLDIGGTKIELRAYNQHNEELIKERIVTPNNYANFISSITELVIQAEAKLGKKGSIGLGLPGAICPKTHVVKNANCTFLNGRHLKQDLEKALNRDVYIANDANCFALSEAMDGVAAGKKVVFGVILGTGCGGGLVVNQQLIIGANAICGEWGHNPLPNYEYSKDGIGQPCYCGRQNCIERFISGTGFEVQYAQRFSETKSAPVIIEAYQRGDHKARLSYYQLVDHIARSFAYIVNMIDPDAIVIGGGLSQVASLYSDIEKQMTQYVFSPDSHTPILKAKYGDSSGVRGAAWLPIIHA
ncbi:transcriptional regulator [Vibrio sp. 10N.286.49.C2]|nr:transcriptional regulator [Vibrio sp. 10N.286.49.C2]PMH56978.1 transcriptional regulator [Vibrio sp. 10N.286.49.B1]PMH79114.1 transcriptional regulator [Vibrio sp. 10N.286.48.B7]